MIGPEPSYYFHTCINLKAFHFSTRMVKSYLRNRCELTSSRMKARSRPWPNVSLMKIFKPNRRAEVASQVSRPTAAPLGAVSPKASGELGAGAAPSDLPISWAILLAAMAMYLK
jgi:hypothetical protein